MMSLDPLKSVISIMDVDDTSLALPSVNQFRSGQQRVMEQVQKTIRRTKSRSSSTLSPTSPIYDYDSVFIDGPKSHSSAANGSLSFGNGYSGALGLEKNMNWHSVSNIKGSTLKTNTAASSYHYHKGYASLGTMAVPQTNTSRSEPDMLWYTSQPKRSAPPQRLLSNMSIYRTERPTSQYIVSTKSQPQLNTMNGFGRSKSSKQIVYSKTLDGFGQSKSNKQFVNSKTLDGFGQGTSNNQFVNGKTLDGFGQGTSNNQFVNGKTLDGFSQGTSNNQFVNSKTLDGFGQAKSSNQFVYSTIDGSKVQSKPQVSQSAVKIKGESGSNGNVAVAEITMKEAVELLSSGDETYQHCGATYIQHNTYIDDKAKEEVLKYNGILPLVSLLQSPSVQVNQAASAALRNLSFKSDKNKEEIHRCSGIEEAASLLRDTDSAEVQKQLTGLLWNLSSADTLKPDLLKTALPVLMERVILPHTTGPDWTNGDPEAFFHTTGCLRNLSSTKQSNRQAMRKCRGLIDSLVKYIQDCVDAEKPEDKSVENCLCILHNLTFQLEAEAPALFSRITALAKPVNRSSSLDDASPIGCFSQQSKSLERERRFDFPVVEDPHPNGAGWLIHSKTLQSYLTLLGSSQQEETQETCLGTLQNLTANEGIVSDVMSHIIVQKLNGLKAISPLIQSNKPNLQRSAVALVGNLTKNPNLQNSLARKALPGLLSTLSAGTKKGNESDDTLAMACQTANCLLLKEPEMSKHLLNNNLINSLKDISQNGYLPKSKKAAAMLLYNLWSAKDLQSFLKRQGMSKSSFVNDVTSAVHKSFQIVD
ncbi:plakophilin-1-like [Pagrus major]|uniref:plakophilin-1-like n=1 Tax=Pagrus major TaxID=143350 RepID=UPI003CC8C548